VAILGFSIECNRFAPPATRAHFGYFVGGDLVAEARAATPRMLPEIPGFVAAMDAASPWAPVGIAFAAAEPNGPVEHTFFAEVLDSCEAQAGNGATGRRRLHLRAWCGADD
jgi:microcystin degradation protein MlrC